MQLKSISEITKKKLEKICQKKKLEIKVKIKITFMILAHASIFSSFPVDYYHNDNINEVKLFVPWGSYLDASAAASILTGKDTPEGMSYEDGDTKSKSKVFDDKGAKVLQLKILKKSKDLMISQEKMMKLAKIYRSLIFKQLTKMQKPLKRQKNLFFLTSLCLILIGS